jgi:transmembrane sensor
MKQDIPWQELHRYFENRANKRDILLAEKWRDSIPVNAEIFKQLQKYFKENRSLPTDFNPDVAKALAKVSTEIYFSPKGKTVKFFPVLLKVASVILIFIGIWWLMNQYIASRQDSNYITVTTTDSTQIEVTLPDSSHIWLNSSSTIKYPKKFGKARDVNLEGEAYFEIAHDTKHPFIVNTSNTQTKVLGTKFDIRSYISEKQDVLIVTDGKVSFGGIEKEQQLFIIGQVGAFSVLTGELSKTENTNPNFLAWQTHQFYFNDNSLESVFKALSEVYCFKYNFEINSLKDRRLTARFSKRPLDEIIKTIAVSSDISVVLQNGIYLIK